MRFLWILIVVGATACAQTNVTSNLTNRMTPSVATKVRVTSDRVSLRAKPGIKGELLDRTMSGDEMIYYDKTNGWVAVQAPDSLNFWVAGEYVKQGIVQPEKLNVRTGPNLNYDVITVVNTGAALSVRGEFKNWLKIAPPPGSRVWISEDYVEIIEPPKPEPEPEPELEPEPAPELEPEAEPEPEPVVEVVPEPEEAKPLMLVLDESQPQGRRDRIPGVLRRANPGLYKLVLIADDFEEPICLVRGRESQLENLLNRALLIEGKVYWVKNIGLPVIQPEKIHLDPIIAE